MTTLTPSGTTLTSPTPPITFELRSGPHTIAGPGETCMVCDDPLSQGEVYLFVAWDGEAGVAHEDCAQLDAAADAAKQSCDLTAARAATPTGASAVLAEGASS